MTTGLPSVSRVYQNHHLDSTRWNYFQPRDDDIVIATSYKSGTTWTQGIVRQLLFLNQALPLLDDASPWLDRRGRPIDEVIADLERQSHRRFIKTHLALDGLPFYPQVKYIVVGRDPRDVFMSLWNHYSSHTDDFLRLVNDLPGRMGDPFPPAPSDIHEFWNGWISRGWFEWEHEGYPYWGNMHHVQTWWDYHDLDNILFVHFADLLSDAALEVRRIADFLDITASDEQITTIVERTTLVAMRTRAEQNAPQMGNLWVDGARSFFYRGTNG